MTEKKITGYKIIPLHEIITQITEERVKELLSSFSSPNRDVEYFLRQKATEFDKQAIAKTHMIFAPYKDKPVLVGYFALAYKDFTIPVKNINRRLRDRIKKFGSYASEIKAYKISAPLIAQLSKNFTGGYNKLISGDELLKIACDMVSELQMIAGGKIVYVECEDNVNLREFYERNGFVIFNERQLDARSQENMDTNCLLQLLRYL